MGQQEVYKILIKEGKELSTDEIHKKLGKRFTRNSIVRCLRQMYRYGEVYRREVSRENRYKIVIVWRIK